MKIADVLPPCISVVLPGCGHIAAGRHAKGLLIFFFFGFAVDGIVYGRAQFFLRPEQGSSAVYVVSLIAAIGLWAYAVGDTVRLALRSRRVEAKADVADDHIRQALVAYLGEDFDAAEATCKAALRINREDADALFYLGVAQAHAGRTRQARRTLRRCLRADVDSKWDDEAWMHLRQLDAEQAGGSGQKDEAAPREETPAGEEAAAPQTSPGGAS